MAAAGQYTIGGSFWEFGEPDWEHARYFLMFGVAEDHDSNPIKLGLGKLKARGAKIRRDQPGAHRLLGDRRRVARRSGPAPTGCSCWRWCTSCCALGAVDLDYLARSPTRAWLVIDAPGAASDGLFARDRQGQPLVARRADARHWRCRQNDRYRAALVGGVRRLPDGRTRA